MANNQIAYGFTGLTHLMAERVTTVGVSVVDRAVRESVAEHNRMISRLLAEFVEPTTDHQIRNKQPGAGSLQPLDDWGNPLPVREAGYYDVAFPIRGGGTAWANNRVSRALMTVEEANRHTLESLRRDADWVKRNILAALFTNTTWTYGDAEFGSLTIQPLANGDTVTFVKRGGAAATDTHYLAQSAAISDSANPYDDIYDELLEHVENPVNGEIVCYIPTSLKATTIALSTFVEPPDVALSYGTTVTTARATQWQDSVRGLGDEVLGRVNRCWIVEWKSLPDGYILARSRGGQAPLAMREYPAAALQGLFAENHSPDGNLNEMRMIRYAGFGGLNRVGALIYYVGGGSYSIPSGYTAPLPS
jgi:hypothetical protein